MVSLSIGSAPVQQGFLSQHHFPNSTSSVTFATNSAKLLSKPHYDVVGLLLRHLWRALYQMPVSNDKKDQSC